MENEWFVLASPLCSHPSICLPIYLSIHPSIHLLLYPSIHLLLYLSIHPFIHPLVYLSIHLHFFNSLIICSSSIHSSTHPSILLFTYISILQMLKLGRLTHVEVIITMCPVLYFTLDKILFLVIQKTGQYVSGTWPRGEWNWWVWHVVINPFATQDCYLFSSS